MFKPSKVERARLRRLDMVEERRLNRSVIAQLATYSFIERQHSVVFHGFTGSPAVVSGMRVGETSGTAPDPAHYIRVPDIAQAWALSRDKPQGQTKFLNK